MRTSITQLALLACAGLVNQAGAQLAVPGIAFSTTTTTTTNITTSTASGDLRAPEVTIPIWPPHRNRTRTTESAYTITSTTSGGARVPEVTIPIWPPRRPRTRTCSRGPFCGRPPHRTRTSRGTRTRTRTCSSGRFCGWPPHHTRTTESSSTTTPTTSGDSRAPEVTVPTTWPRRNRTLRPSGTPTSSTEVLPTGHPDTGAVVAHVGNADEKDDRQDNHRQDEEEKDRFSDLPDHDFYDLWPGNGDKPETAVPSNEPVTDDKTTTNDGRFTTMSA